MSDNFYDELNDKPATGPNLGPKLNIADLRPVFFEFFDHFKTYLAEYTRESLVGLDVSEIEITVKPQIIFDETKGVRVILKNQGEITCLLTTDGKGKFQLDPGEKEAFWINRTLLAATLSGMTVLGFIRY